MQPVDEEDVCEIASDVWTSMLGTELEVVEPSDEIAWSDKLSSCVTISGTWNGVVVLDFSPPFGRTAAGLMFGMEDAEITESEVTDTVGELANMVGGSIKSLLDEPCKLGIPVVGSDVEALVEGDDCHPVIRLFFQCEGQPITVTMYEQGEQAGGTEPESE